MNTKLIIPKKCKVGFNTRSDTYTGKLGYVIYHDGKVWRKETSWEGWREREATEEEMKKALEYYKENYSNKNPEYYKPLTNFDELPYHARQGKFGKGVEPIEFDNVPTEGFVLNKKVGGTRGHSWEQRATYTRVYDPRGWEFEISVPNLLYILENATSIKGKGLEGKFVYTWDGKDLVLVPEEAPEYKEMVEFTQLQDKKVKSKELVLGKKYKDKKDQIVTYLGRYDTWSNTSTSYSKREKDKTLPTTIRKKTKSFVFADSSDNISVISSASHIAVDLEEPNSSFPELLEKFLKSTIAAPVSSVQETPFVLRELDKTPKKGYSSHGSSHYIPFVVKISDKEYHVYNAIPETKSEYKGSVNYYWEDSFLLYLSGKYKLIEDGCFENYYEWTRLKNEKGSTRLYNWNRTDKFSKEDIDKLFPSKLRVKFKLSNNETINITKD